MHLISALASGFVGAENGYVDVYSRGTSTIATCYTDFEATASVSGSQIELDANGRVMLYVNEFVRVVVKDVNGATVATFTDGIAAPLLEVISQAFTGTSYADGSTGVGKPTTGQSIFDRWLDSAGAPDWEILDPDGNPVSLQEALASSVGIFYNVKTYGALGNTTQDDTAFIEAAIAACVAGGGGIVFFPAGTYRITSAITWPATVSLLGVGSAVSIITVDHATANGISVTAAGRRSMLDLALQTSQANTGNLLKIDAASAITHLRVGRVAFGSGTTEGDLVQIDGNAEHIVYLQDCRMLVAGSGNSAIDSTNANHKVFTRDNHVFQNQATYTGSLYKATGHITATGDIFSFTGHTSGTLNAVENNGASGSVTLNGCKLLFGTDPGGTEYGVAWVAGARIDIAGNSWFPQQSTHRRFNAGGVAGQGSNIADLDYTDATISGTTATVADGFGVYVIHSTNASPPAITLPTKMFPGQRLMLTVFNANVGNWGAAYTFVGAELPSSVYVPATANLNSGQMGVHELMVIDHDNDGTYGWHFLLP